MTGGNPGKEAAARRLREAAEWRLIGLLFERPRPGWHAETGRLAAELEEGPLGRAAAAATGADEGLYLRLLGPGGVASPREAAYRGHRDPAEILAELAAYYRAFAYRPRAEDPPDHVALEVGFIGYLKLKEACALDVENAEAAAVTESAIQRFIADHLRTVAGPLFERLSAAGPSYLTWAAAELLARTGPPDADRPNDVDREEGFACGLGASCGETCPVEEAGFVFEPPPPPRSPGS